MCVCLVSCGDQDCCATSAKNPSGSNCNVTYWEGRNRVPKNRCEDQTQEVFIMDFRHSYVYHIWFIQEYTKVLSQNARVFPGFLALHIPEKPNVSWITGLHACICHVLPKSLKSLKRWPKLVCLGSWSEAKAPTKTGRKLLPYNFCYYLAGN